MSTHNPYFETRLGIAQAILYKLSFQEYTYSKLSRASAESKYWTAHTYNKALMWLCKEGHVLRPLKKRGNYKITDKGKAFLKVLPKPEKPHP